MNDLNLHARIFRTGTAWYADIDDLGDPLPEDPYWYGLYDSQPAAVEAACTRIASLSTTQCHRLSHGALTA
ncbi:hypothetical protein [Kribbella sp. NPDC051770]|uniref:hypothetical protein n=1 Tax=Kribbella sp. NPDC051770 TaxID=3155413 RepID=UPI003420B221